MMAMRGRVNQAITAVNPSSASCSVASRAMRALRTFPWRRVVVGVLVLATASSFAYGLWLTDWSASQAYFSTLTRAWVTAPDDLAPDVLIAE